jgi:hypothetical protein
MEITCIIQIYLTEHLDLEKWKNYKNGVQQTVYNYFPGLTYLQKPLQIFYQPYKVVLADSAFIH